MENLNNLNKLNERYNKLLVTLSTTSPWNTKWDNFLDTKDDIKNILDKRLSVKNIKKYSHGGLGMKRRQEYLNSLELIEIGKNLV